MSFTFDLELNLNTTVPGNTTYYNYDLLIPTPMSKASYDEEVDTARVNRAMMNLFSSNKFVFKVVDPINNFNGSLNVGTVRFQNNNLIITLKNRFSHEKNTYNGTPNYDNFTASFTLEVLPFGTNDIFTSYYEGHKKYIDILKQIGFRSFQEFCKAMYYYIKIGRIRVEAGTYTYNLFNGRNNHFIKSIHSNGELIPAIDVNESYEKEGDNFDKFHFYESSVFDIIIKGGIYNIYEKGSTIHFKYINSINDIQYHYSPGMLIANLTDSKYSKDLHKIIFTPDH